PAILDPAKAIALGLRRFEGWLKNPEGAAWHAAKRIFAYALMIEGGIKRDVIDAYLAASPWVNDFARAPFALTSADFSKTILESMLASGAIAWQGDQLISCSPHTPTDPSWPKSPTVPRLWEQ